MDYDLDRLLQDFEKEKLVVATVAERASNLVQQRDKQIAVLKNENLDLRKKIEALNKQIDFILVNGHTATNRVLRVGNQQITVDWTSKERPSEATWIAEDTPVGATKEVFGVRERLWAKGKVKGKPTFSLGSASSTTGSTAGSTAGTEAAPVTLAVGESSKAAAEVDQAPVQSSAAAVTEQSVYNRPPNRRRTFVPSVVASRKDAAAQEGTNASGTGPQGVVSDNGVSASPHTTNSFTSSSMDLATAQPTTQQSTNPLDPSSSKKRSLSEADTLTAAPVQRQEMYFGSDSSSVGTGEGAGNGSAGPSASNANPSGNVVSTVSTTAQSTVGVSTGPAAAVGASSSAAPTGSSKHDQMDELARQMILGLDGGSPLVDNTTAYRNQQQQQQQQQLVSSAAQRSHLQQYQPPQPQQQQGVALNTAWGSAVPVSWQPAPPQMSRSYGYNPAYPPTHQVPQGAVLMHAAQQQARQWGQAGQVHQLQIPGVRPPQPLGVPPQYVQQQLIQQMQQRPTAPVGQAPRPTGTASQTAPTVAPETAATAVTKPLDYSVLISANKADLSSLVGPPGTTTATASPRAQPASTTTAPPPAKKAKTGASNMAKLMQEHQLAKTMQQANSSTSAASGVAKPPAAAASTAPVALPIGNKAPAVPSATLAAPGPGAPRTTVPLPTTQPLPAQSKAPVPGASVAAIAPSSASSGNASASSAAVKPPQDKVPSNSNGASGSSSSSSGNSVAGGEGATGGGSASGGSVVSTVSTPSAAADRAAVSKSSAVPTDNPLSIAPGPADTPQAWHEAYGDLYMRRNVIRTMIEKSKEYRTKHQDKAWLADRKSYCMVLERVLYSQAVSKQQYMHAISEAIKEGLV